MAKVTKNQLKKLIKECMLEILMEGFGPEDRLTEAISHAQRDHVREGRIKQRSSRVPVQQQRPHYPGMDKLERQNTTPAQQHDMSTVLNSLGPALQNPLMASIFQDTAATTLREQGSSDPYGNTLPHEIERPIVPPGADAAQHAAAQIDPTQVQGSDRWASLALASPRGKVPFPR